jgi:hypothetical protein
VLVSHLRGVPDERIDIDIDTTGVALRVRRAMQEHRTQWNDTRLERSVRGRYFSKPDSVWPRMRARKRKWLRGDAQSHNETHEGDWSMGRVGMTGLGCQLTQ